MRNGSGATSKRPASTASREGRLPSCHPAVRSFPPLPSKLARRQAPLTWQAGRRARCRLGSIPFPEWVDRLRGTSSRPRGRGYSGRDASPIEE